MKNIIFGLFILLSLNASADLTDEMCENDPSVKEQCEQADRVYSAQIELESFKNDFFSKIKKMKENESCELTGFVKSLNDYQKVYFEMYSKECEFKTYCYNPNNLTVCGQAHYGAFESCNSKVTSDFLQRLKKIELTTYGCPSLWGEF
jgi:hypothetical protein